MKKIYLSASTQEGNACYPLPGIPCKTEEQHCQDVMDRVAVRLLNHGFSIRRNTPEMTWDTSYKDSNAWGADMFLCLHTNGSADTAKRGAYWAYITNGGKTRALADLLAKYTSMDGVTVSAANKTGAAGFGELDNCTAQHAAYAELGYHSNQEDHAWLHRNIAAIVEGITRAACEYMGVKYVAAGTTEPEQPEQPKPQKYPAAYFYSGANGVNLRDKPNGADIGDVKADDIVIVLQVIHTDQDWAEVVKLNTMERGYCITPYLEACNIQVTH